MDIALELANYLQDAGFGTVGTDIFAGQIPSNTDGIYIYRIGGTNENYVPIERPVVDIYCLNPSSATCIQTLENIKRFIHRMVDTETDNTWIYSILAFGDVQDVDRDLEYNKVYKISIELIIRDKSLIS